MFAKKKFQAYLKIFAIFGKHLPHVYSFIEFVVSGGNTFGSGFLVSRRIWLSITSNNIIKTPIIVFKIISNFPFFRDKIIKLGNFRRLIWPLNTFPISRTSLCIWYSTYKHYIVRHHDACSQIIGYILTYLYQTSPKICYVL